MDIVLESERKRKKVLRKVKVVDRERYEGLDLDTKVEMIRSLVPPGLMYLEEMLDAEVLALAGERYRRKEGGASAGRHGSNPGSVRLAGQRVARVRGEQGEVQLQAYGRLRGTGEVDEMMLKRVLYGISCRNYEAAAEAIPGAIGLSPSTVSRRFIQASAAKLQELRERDLSGEDVVAVFLDGKTFAGTTLVVALGITLSGEKRFPGFVETGTENEKVLTPFLRSLVEERCGKVDAWKNSNQRQRWLATALLDIEPRLHRVRGYRHLLLLREALRRHLHINADKDLEVA